MSPPELDAELRALWLVKRQLEVDVQPPSEAAEAPVPTGLGDKSGIVPTNSSLTPDGGNANLPSVDSNLAGVFPQFPPFPPFWKRETGKEEMEWTEERMRWEERAAVLEFDAGLSRADAEALARRQC